MTTDTTDTLVPPPARLRAADTDRQATVHLLQDAAARGLLTPDEAGERMAAAYAAQHLDELPPLTADLPPMTPPAPAAPGWRGLLTLLVLQIRAGFAYLTANGWRSRRALAAVAVLVVVLGGLVALGVFGFGDVGGPGGHGGPAGFGGGHGR
jgi:VIT1/CCC1 family predicted Fe2+/Mn2+ transporter